MLTEKQIEDVIEELEEISKAATLAYSQLNVGLSDTNAARLVRTIKSRARTALKILITEEPQSRDCW